MSSFVNGVSFRKPVLLEKWGFLFVVTYQVPNKKSAIVCRLGDFHTYHVPSVSGDELLNCMRYVVQPHNNISTLAMCNRVQLASESDLLHARVPRMRFLATNCPRGEPRVLPFADANCWSFFKDAGNRWGTGKPAAEKPFSKVFMRPTHHINFEQASVTNY